MSRLHMRPMRILGARDGVLVGAHLPFGVEDRYAVGIVLPLDLVSDRFQDVLRLREGILGIVDAGRVLGPVQLGLGSAQLSLLGIEGLARGHWIDRRQHLTGLDMVADFDVDRGQLSTCGEAEILLIGS